MLRELNRLEQLGFIKLAPATTAEDLCVVVDFEAIARY
jgi:hypothetical protein